MKIFNRPPPRQAMSIREGSQTYLHHISHDRDRSLSKCRSIILRAPITAYHSSKLPIWCYRNRLLWRVSTAFNLGVTNRCRQSPVKLVLDRETEACTTPGGECLSTNEEVSMKSEVEMFSVRLRGKYYSIE